MWSIGFACRLSRPSRPPVPGHAGEGVRGDGHGNCGLQKWDDARQLLALGCILEEEGASSAASA
eukprot:scaffold54147_cov21-Tisochrysis_lutea.AAC.3